MEASRSSNRPPCQVLGFGCDARGGWGLKALRRHIPAPRADVRAMRTGGSLTSNDHCKSKSAASPLRADEGVRAVPVRSQYAFSSTSASSSASLPRPVGRILRSADLSFSVASEREVAKIE